MKREIGQFIEYKANLNCWNPERLHSFARLRMGLGPESRTRVAMLKRREADLISLEPQGIEPLKKGGYQIIGPRDTGYPMLVLYKSYAPTFLTHTIEFRKALILSVDWNAVVKAFYPAEVDERQKGGAPLDELVHQRRHGGLVALQHAGGAG